MLDNLKVYKIWAPENTFWTEWVKPVSFANMRKRAFEGLSIPEVSWMSQVDRSTAVIIDLPDKNGVLEGLSLARLGYRPVPLYNGVYYSNIFKMVVNVHEIQKALYDGAEKLSAFNIAPDAPPAFLLDSNRMNGASISGKFDNRWSIFPQDMPSASYLIGKKIRNVVVRTDRIRDDLKYILHRYQSLGIAIYTDDGENRKPVKIAKPFKLKELFYRFFVIMGLKRNSAGGFGGILPESSGGGYG